MKIRKQVYELTMDDLNRSPVWEYALDEEAEEESDEATVRPHRIKGALDPAEGSFIIRAVFTLADGTVMNGYLTPPDQGDDSLQPVIITERGQVVFDYGMFVPDPNDLAQSYERLGRVADNVFPIHVVSGVELVSGAVSAEIPGFLTLDETGLTIETK